MKNMLFEKLTSLLLEALRMKMVHFVTFFGSILMLSVCTTYIGLVVTGPLGFLITLFPLIVLYFVLDACAKVRASSYARTKLVD
ncbi:hypothetical protein [Shewanella xiamenensis]|uniref:hypothetical protein n=1 Tax=Shewanella xiamenensis TaxID=332186 RepID=UPI0024A74B09|nr:hypothetical protein [Shewanella xiamenensis]